MNDRDPLHFCTFSLVTIQSPRSRIRTSTGRKGGPEGGLLSATPLSRRRFTVDESYPIQKRFSATSRVGRENSMENGKTRHRFRTLAFAMAMLTLAGGQWSASADENTPTLMFGAYVAARNGLSIQASVQAMEARLGRPLAAVRASMCGTSPSRAAMTCGCVTRDTPCSSPWMQCGRIRSASVAFPRRLEPGSALYNEMVGWANRIKAFGAHIYFTFNHEPEEKAGTVAGTAADFIDAWRKMVTVFRAQGVTNAEYTWIMTDYAFWRTDGGAPRSGTRAMRTSTTSRATPTTGTTAVRASTTNGGGGGGSVDGWGLQREERERRACSSPSSLRTKTETPGGKARWNKDVQKLFKKKSWVQFQAILYYHQSHKPTCLFWLDSSTTSMAAITALANDPSSVDMKSVRMRLRPHRENRRRAATLLVR